MALAGERSLPALKVDPALAGSLRVRVLGNGAARLAAKAIVRVAPGLYSRASCSYAGIVPIKIAGVKIRYALGPSDPIGDLLYWRGADAWERGVVRTFAELAKRTDGCVVDIGANCGIYSILACAVNPAVTVKAWEPIGKLRERILLSAAANGFGNRIQVREAAAGSRSATETFYVHEDPTQSALIDSSGSGVPMTVQVEKIDDVLTERVGLVKIDVEGHEAEALSGMSRILSTDRPPVIFECLGDWDITYWESSSRLFMQHSYALHAISDDRGLIETKEFVSGISNYLALPVPAK